MHQPDDAAVFRALSDSTRRHLLDRLYERNGQTLTELCAGLAMRRQSITQHLQLLESANLVATVRRGRERLHFLNPVPLHEMQERWIRKFEQPRLQVLDDIKRQAQGPHMNSIPTYVYVTYIASSPERVWEALTDADLTARFWGHSNASTWERGARWEHLRTDGSGIADTGGIVIESVPPRRLVFTMEDPRSETEPTRVTFAIDPHEDIVRLTVTHEGFASAADRDLASLGWAAVCANLKTLIETGDVMPQAPWEMHAEARQEQMAGN